MKIDKTGILYGVSVGTGDPELITVKALKILQNTNIIAFPAGIKNQLGVAQKIIQPYLQPHQRLLPLNFPYTLCQQTLNQAWHFLSMEVWEFLKTGEDVVFACEGDISFYSTFSYLALTLQNLYPSLQVKRIAGVASPMASASALGLPLTIQGEKLVILPAIYSLSELENALDLGDVVVLMKVASVYSQVWGILAQRALFDRAYLVEKATTGDEKVYTNLENYPQLSLSYFSILVILKNRFDRVIDLEINH